MATKPTRRPTADIIIIGLSAVVGFVILTTTLAVTVVLVFGLDADVSNLVTRVTGMTNTLIGLIAGYMAGRSTSNGRTPPSS